MATSTFDFFEKVYHLSEHQSAPAILREEVALGAKGDRFLSLANAGVPEADQALPPPQNHCASTPDPLRLRDDSDQSRCTESVPIPRRRRSRRRAGRPQSGDGANASALEPDRRLPSLRNHGASMPVTPRLRVAAAARLHARAPRAAPAAVAERAVRCARCRTGGISCRTRCGCWRSSPTRSRRASSELATLVHRVASASAFNARWGLPTCLKWIIQEFRNLQAVCLLSPRAFTVGDHTPSPAGLLQPPCRWSCGIGLRPDKRLPSADLLASPSGWATMSDPLSALLVDLADGTERSEAVRFFRATLPPSVRVHSVARVQNLPMWQSYVVKRHTPPHGWVDFMKALPLHNQGRPRRHPPPRWGRPEAQPTDTRIHNA